MKKTNTPAVEGPSEKIAAYVKERILNGTYKINEKISERALCELFGVSRTPVRLAFDRLKSSGWLYSRSKSGTYVAPVDDDDVTDNYNARIALEPQILLMAYSNMTDADFAEMRRILDEIKNGPPESYHSLELGLHKVYVEKTNNRYVRSFIGTMEENMERLAALSSLSGTRRPQSIREWNLVIENLEHHNPVKASQRLQKHLINSFENYCRNRIL